MLGPEWLALITEGWVFALVVGVSVAMRWRCSRILREQERLHQKRAEEFDRELRELLESESRRL